MHILEIHIPYVSPALDWLSLSIVNSSFMSEILSSSGFVTSCTIRFTLNQNHVYILCKVSYYVSKLTSSADKLRSRFLDSSFLCSSRAFLSFASVTVFFIASFPLSSSNAHISLDTPSGGSSVRSLFAESENILSFQAFLIWVLIFSDPPSLNYNIPESVSDLSQPDRKTSDVVFSGFLLARFLFRSLAK